MSVSDDGYYTKEAKSKEFFAEEEHKLDSDQNSGDSKKIEELSSILNTSDIIPMLYDSTLKMYFSPERKRLPLSGDENSAQELLSKLYPPGTPSKKLSSTRTTSLPYMLSPLELGDVDPVFYDHKIDALWSDETLTQKKRSNAMSMPLLKPSAMDEVQSVMYDRDLGIFFLNEKNIDEEAVIIDGKVFHDPKVSYSNYLARQYPERNRGSAKETAKKDILAKPAEQAKPAFRAGIYKPKTKPEKRMTQVVTRKPFRMESIPLKQAHDKTLNRLARLPNTGVYGSRQGSRYIVYKE